MNWDCPHCGAGPYDVPEDHYAGLPDCNKEVLSWHGELLRELSMTTAP